jgi:hypothetical protein
MRLLDSSCSGCRLTCGLGCKLRIHFKRKLLAMLFLF